MRRRNVWRFIIPSRASLATVRVYMFDLFIYFSLYVAGRFIDKIDVASAGSLPRIKVSFDLLRGGYGESVGDEL